MWLLLALLSSLTFGLAGFMMKASQAKQGETAALLWGLYASGTAGFALWMMRQDSVDLSAWTWLAGLVVGAGSAWGNLLFMKALDSGPASLTSPIVNLHTAFTVLLSVLAYGERLTWQEWTGVLLLTATAALLPVDPDEQLRIRDPRWYALVWLAAGLFFLRNGGLKITEEAGMDNTSILFVSYLFGLLWFTPPFLRTRASGIDRGSLRTGLVWGLASGIFSFAGMQVYAMALESGPASIVAPIFSTNSLVVAVMSMAVFRERLSRMQTFCLIFFFIGMFLVRSG
ncbi:DMT family transporter [Staphylospora marina]|uniref:DMT family transporter n=1 Tax=Staphylospora marina TaxID=2490858 RepID=UPI000F5BBA7D|nr:DMT family transporter [Staphylospora marina]